MDVIGIHQVFKEKTVERNDCKPEYKRDQNDEKQQPNG